MDSEEYLKTDYKNLKVIKTEILFTPLLIVFPLIIAGTLISDWYLKGYVRGNSSAFEGELILGIIILIGNIIFDIPFIKSLTRYRRK
jgi:hypothetical protein